MTNRLKRAVNPGAEGDGKVAHAPETSGVGVGAGVAVAVGDGVAITGGVLLLLPPQDHKPATTIDRTINSDFFDSENRVTGRDSADPISTRAPKPF